MLKQLAWLMLLCATVSAQEVTMPLSEWQALRLRERALQKAAESPVDDGIAVVGETRYRGRIEAAGLRLTMLLRAELGTTTTYKVVPIIGSDVIVLSARAGVTPIALTSGDTYWTWTTRERGAVDLTVELVVPASGPRGSTEYRFAVVESPVTELSCTFADRDLSPRVEGAVTNVVRPNGAGGELSSIIGPTTEIHLVGFRELAEAPKGTAKVYADTQTLMSLSDDVIELFSAVSFTILYAPQKRFRVALPEGYELVSADGEGAFQYTVEGTGADRVLTGETTYGIRQSYEISLRLKRPLSASDSSVALALPRALDVERDSGFIAVEIPGKIAITAVEPDNEARMTALDVRELPATLISSSVTPIVRAFQYNDARSRTRLGIARYPTKTLESGSIDTLSAVGVLTVDGRLLTELTVSMRNAVQQYLVAELAQGAEVRSAMVEGRPVKPSRDSSGKLLIPLVRSQPESEGLRPIIVQLVYEERGKSLSVVGSHRLTLPSLNLPVASLEWTVYVPDELAIGELCGAVEPQLFVQNATWKGGPEAESDDRNDFGALQTQNAPSESARREPQAAQRPAAIGQLARTPANDGNSGGMAVRVQVPKSGRAVSYARYWAQAGEPVWVNFRYIGRAWLRSLEVLGALLVLAAMVVVVLRAGSTRGRVITWSRATLAQQLASGKAAIQGRADSFALRFRERKGQSLVWALVAAAAEIAFTCVLVGLAAGLVIALLVALMNLALIADNPI